MWRLLVLAAAVYAQEIEEAAVEQYVEPCDQLQRNLDEALKRLQQIGPAQPVLPPALAPAADEDSALADTAPAASN